MKKIILIGSGGSGKSTLARQLGEKLKIKVYHLDALFWNWNRAFHSARRAQGELGELARTAGWHVLPCG